MTIKLNEKNYEIVKNYKDGFNEEELINKFTDYYYDYDYILGDWAYGKLRLKGFCDKKNPKFNRINDYETVNDYIKNYCAYECQYFIIKRIDK